MEYKVRDNFYVHLHEKVYEPGTVLDLSDDDAAMVAHQIEPVAPVKTSKKVKADDAK